jgi:glycosyltransferase involved in cell wall biosynthesis
LRLRIVATTKPTTLLRSESGVVGAANAAPNVAVVVSQLSYGGAERQTVELLKALHGTPWAPRQIICLSDDVMPYGSTIRSLGYHLSVIPRSGGFEMQRVRQLRRQLVEQRIAIVHAVNWLAAAYCLVSAPRGTRIVTSIRNSRLPATRMRRLLLRYLLRRSAAIMVNSESARTLVLDECGMSPDRVTLVRNGVDLERLRKAAVPGAVRRELLIPEDAPVVAYVGRNAKVKNIPLLLDVAERLLSSRLDLHVVIAGEGLERHILAGTNLAHEPRVHCLGARQDIPSLLSDATVLVLTSESEGTPNVVLEALAASVPVVATPAGDVANLVPPGCGAVVPAKVDALAAAVERTLSTRGAHQPAFDSHARRIVQSYSVPLMVSGTTDVWKQTATRSL